MSGLDSCSGTRDRMRRRGLEQEFLDHVSQALREIRRTGWLAWRKLNTPSALKISPSCRPDCRETVYTLSVGSRGAPFCGSMRCISDRGPGLRKAHFGWLTRIDDGSVFFVARRKRGAARRRNSLSRTLP